MCSKDFHLHLAENLAQTHFIKGADSLSKLKYIRGGGAGFLSVSLFFAFSLLSCFLSFALSTVASLPGLHLPSYLCRFPITNRRWLQHSQIPHLLRFSLAGGGILQSLSSFPGECLLSLLIG